MAPEKNFPQVGTKYEAKTWQTSNSKVLCHSVMQLLNMFTWTVHKILADAPELAAMS